MDWYFGHVWLTRLLLQRGMAAIYLVAFIGMAREWKPLLGENGLLPVPEFARQTSWREAPSLFLWRYSDRLATAVALTGITLSTCALVGVTDAGPLWLSLAVWLILWSLYLSVVNVGQRFYSFGWESMVVEAGFFTAFLGPRWLAPSILPVLILRWMLFRTEVGAGLIKLRHDPCWKNLTCLYWHYETQPLPNPLSWYFHRIPKPLHRFAVLFSHFVQVAAPFALFAPQPISSIAGALAIFHQLWLIVSGNYSWLNWLTVVLGFAAFDDRALSLLFPLTTPALAARSLGFEILLWAVTALTLWLSVQPAKNLFSANQLMNYSWNPFHLVNAYGAFGSVGKERYEIVLEGTRDQVITPATQWQEYSFAAKPGDVRRMPPQIAPSHLRLDWLIWFLPFSVIVTSAGVRVGGYNIWFLRFVRKLLENDPGILRIMGRNPFPDAPPRYLRALFYQYRFTTPAEKHATGAWWARTLRGTYLKPVSLSDLEGL